MWSHDFIFATAFERTSSFAEFFFELPTHKLIGLELKPQYSDFLLCPIEVHIGIHYRQCYLFHIQLLLAQGKGINCITGIFRMYFNQCEFPSVYNIHIYI